MFTYKKIKLSEIQKDINFELVVDSEISFASKIGTCNPYLRNALVYAISEKFLELGLKSEKNVAFIVNKKDYFKKISQKNKGVIFSDDPKTLLSKIQTYLSKKVDFQWENFTSKISKKAKVHPSAIISNTNVTIGDNSYIGPNAIINERSIIGDNCNIGEGVVIGSEAFEITGKDSSRKIISQSGGVKLNNNVNIQALSTVVRATFGGFTTINENVKIDSHVHIAHDSQIGKNSSVAASSFIAGNVSIGGKVFIGPGSSVANGVEIGDGAWVTIGSTVVDNVMPEQKVSGNFAIDHIKFLKKYKSE